MQLKDGGTYRTRSGGIVKVTQLSPITVPYPFQGDNLHMFMLDGLYIEDEPGFEALRVFDLVEEIQ